MPGQPHHERRAPRVPQPREILARPDLWEEDFQVVTHWVPQFLWFGIWLADGRP